jgi:hypothetical protein
MSIVLRSLFDPATQNINLCRRQDFSGLCGRHVQVCIGRGDSFQQFAVIRVVGHNRSRPGLGWFHRGAALIQTQPGGSMSIIRTVTLKTVLRQDRPDIAIELNIIRRADWQQWQRQNCHQTGDRPGRCADPVHGGKLGRMKATAERLGRNQTLDQKSSQVWAQIKGALWAVS